ncbi:ABC transporter permease [Kribbella sandramycini]|uniref:ABC transporter permease n=1 Tax=Kribbella sandramycini TaxID=60450 RepID=A0A7Y4NZF8_9ACTN|nr:ABC transporter permease [Kribbella sandramycini]MBB6567256.1 peptide/nickel transport system permease protein [Kribbella sandramycini]NOL40130.1 ABC transporter permease [Kribbella sandramycini]
MATAVTAPRVLENAWVRFAARRLGRLVVSVWVVITAAFLMIHLVPGDPVRAVLGPTATAEVVAAKRAALGLDDPMWSQYLHYLQGVLTGDFGTGLASSLPVSQVISQRLPTTAMLAVLAFLVAVAIAIPVGVFMGVLTRGGRARRAELSFTATSVVLAAVPEFLLAVGLVYVFGVSLGWLPVAGRSGASSYVLPVLALAIGPAAVLSRIVRVQLQSVLQADYVRTARAKRLRAVTVYLKHALPNTLTATLTLGGLLLSVLVAGTVLVENVFAWPGLGTTMISSILARDYPVVQAIVLVYGVGVLLVNLAVDIALALLDPRSTIRES